MDFDYPVKLPRWTSEEFDQKRKEYGSKHGYEIHIPGWHEIIKLGRPDEPTKAELSAYRKKDVSLLGAKRYDEIKWIMDKKRENFLRMMASPTPRWVQNVGTALTFLDDINDTLGTLAVIARITAHALPKAAARYLMGPAGWMIVGSDVASISLGLAMAPFKAKRLQHQYHEVVDGLPYTKKTRWHIWQRMKRRFKRGLPLTKERMRAIAENLKRINISSAELIEAAQVSENVTGYGLSLGPITALMYSIPAGLYHHVRGEKVTITGLPRPLVWFDRAWNRGLQAAAHIFTNPSPYTDEQRMKALFAYDLSTQVLQSVMQDTPILDLLPDLDGVYMTAPPLRYPSTYETLMEAGIDPRTRNGWPYTGSRYMAPEHLYNNRRHYFRDVLHGYYDRNKRDLSYLPSAQAADQAGLYTLALLGGRESVDWRFEQTTQSLLQLSNMGLRFPEDCTEEQARKWSDILTAYDKADMEVDSQTAQHLAKEYCNFEFTTKVPQWTY